MWRGLDAATKWTPGEPGHRLLAHGPPGIRLLKKLSHENVVSLRYVGLGYPNSPGYDFTGLMGTTGVKLMGTRTKKHMRPFISQERG